MKLLIISIYNILHLVSLVFLAPLTVLMMIFSVKYKQRIPERLGFGLASLVKEKTRTRVWIHALSVGEVLSAKPLVKTMRKEMPDCEIIFSTVTQGGQLLQKEMAQEVDHFIPFPFDFFFTVKKFVRVVDPDIFILIETDLWPNIIWHLHDKRVPCVLVNGRIAERSFRRYQVLKPLFSSFLNDFSILCMQMQAGVEQLKELGVDSKKIKFLGNLKFDLGLSLGAAPDFSDLLSEFQGSNVIVAGSTHPGEEEILLDVFVQIQKKQSNCFLVIAPRNIERAENILGMARKKGLEACMRSELNEYGGQIVILDTLGELVHLYKYADIAFVGGSLVDQRGHNPLEPAWWGVPVMFGPYMQDFQEASQGLIEAGAAKQITAEDLAGPFLQLLAKPSLLVEMGRNASGFIAKHKGSAQKYSQIIKQTLESNVT